jgi:hypothetical protein
MDLEPITDPAQTLDTAMTWAHDQGDYSPREFADGSAYRCELQMMADEWVDRYPNVAGALELLERTRVIDLTGLSDSQARLLASHKSDSGQLRKMMAERMRKINRQRLGLPIGCAPELIEELLVAAGEVTQL